MPHTPGPWKVSEYDCKIIVDFAGSIAKVERNYLSNARLIAAAPEMLEALKDFSNSSFLPELFRNHIKSIIARAEGKE